MARTPMVTRTMTITKATVMCLDIEKGEPISREVTLPRTYKDEKSLMKAAQKFFGEGAVKPVHIVSSETVEALYGMSENDFIKYAELLPTRNAPLPTPEGTETAEPTQTVTE